MVRLQVWSSRSIRSLSSVAYFLFTLPSGMSASYAGRLFSWLSFWHQQKIELGAALVTLRLRIRLLFLKYWTKSQSSGLYAHHWIKKIWPDGEIGFKPIRAPLYNCDWVNSTLNPWLLHNEHKCWGSNANIYYRM